jgi:hypothetical protein
MMCDADGLSTYNGQGWFSSGEVELLIPGGWPRRGVWGAVGNWQIMQQDAIRLHVRGTIEENGLRLTRDMILESASSSLSTVITCTNLTPQTRPVMIASHPELTLGGRADDADVLFFYRNGLEQLDYRIGQPNIAYEFTPTGNVWGVLDAARQVAYVRAFPASELVWQYIFMGPSNYNLEEIGKTQQLGPGQSITAHRSIWLASGLSAVQGLSSQWIAQVQPEIDVIAAGKDATLRLCVASPKAVDSFPIDVRVGKAHQQLQIKLTAGQATTRRVTLPASWLTSPLNSIDVVFGDQGLTVSTSQRVDTDFVERVTRRFQSLADKLAESPTAQQATDRKHIRQQIRARQVKWVIEDAQRWYDQGRLEQAWHCLELIQDQ